MDLTDLVNRVAQRCPEGAGRPHHARPGLEGLEGRELPAVGLTALNPVLDKGVLSVMGSNAGDVIDVTGANGYVRVLGKAFPAAAVRAIVIDGMSGNDTIRVSEAIGARTYLYGGYGSDSIQGGGGGDVMYGGAGNDRLYGRRGTDLLYGGSGIDTLDGGIGTDYAHGGSGRTVFVSVNAGISKGSTRTAYASAGNGVVLNEIVRLTNLERTRRGLRALTNAFALNTVAGNYTSTMWTLQVPVGGGASHNTSGHTGPTPGSRLDANLIEHNAYAENIYWSSAALSARAVLDGWMASPGHRANLLDPNLVYVGVGMTGDGVRGFYYTQVFVR
jgi:uncharacterized protein YkwD